MADDRKPVSLTGVAHRASTAAVVRSPRWCSVSPLLAGMATPALGWGNGGNLGNGYGTHDWIISQALKVFGDQPPAWFDLNAALLASDDPDKVFWAANEHVFYEKGYGRGAVDRISEFYHQALVAHQAGDDVTASTTFGWMAHYFGDILQPYHTNYAASPPRRFAPALRATWSGTPTRNPDASPEWITDDRHAEGRSHDVRATSIAAAAYSRKFFPELYSMFKVDETVLAPRVLEITGFLLKRASADLADMLYSIDQGVGEAAPVASVKASVRWRYAAKNSTQTVYVTVKGAAGQPLEGVRVDIAFPNANRRNDPPSPLHDHEPASPTAVAAIGASPFGVRRDVGVTVKTGGRRHDQRRHGSRPAASLAARYRPVQVGVNDTTLYPGQEVRVGSLARDRLGRAVPNLKVTWTFTFATARSSRAAATRTPMAGRMTLPITDATPKGLVTVVARTQSASVNRTSTSSFRIY